MKLLKVVRQKTPWKPDIGDVLGEGASFVKCAFEMGMIEKANLVGVGYLGPSPWGALGRLGVDSKQIMGLFAYECPFIKGNRYWHFCPWLIITSKNTDEYRQRAKTRYMSWLDMAVDSDWVRKMYVGSYRNPDSPYRINPDKIEPDRVSAAILGHGYTYCTLPSDGHGCHELACLELDNGDLLVGWLWVWFNK